VPTWLMQSRMWRHGTRQLTRSELGRMAFPWFSRGGWACLAGKGETMPISFLTFQCGREAEPDVLAVEMASGDRGTIPRAPVTYIRPM